MGEVRQTNFRVDQDTADKFPGVLRGGRNEPGTGI